MIVLRAASRGRSPTDTKRAECVVYGWRLRSGPRLQDRHRPGEAAGIGERVPGR